jgi:hypothetical protein
MTYDALIRMVSGFPKSSCLGSRQRKSYRPLTPESGRRPKEAKCRGDGEDDHLSGQKHSPVPLEGRSGYMPVPRNNRAWTPRNQMHDRVAENTTQYAISNHIRPRRNSRQIILKDFNVVVLLSAESISGRQPRCDGTHWLMGSK